MGPFAEAKNYFCASDASVGMCFGIFNQAVEGAAKFNPHEEQGGIHAPVVLKSGVDVELKFATADVQYDLAVFNGLIGGETPTKKEIHIEGIAESFKYA